MFIDNIVVCFVTHEFKLINDCFNNKIIFLYYILYLIFIVVLEKRLLLSLVNFLQNFILLKSLKFFEANFLSVLMIYFHNLIYLCY